MHTKLLTAAVCLAFYAYFCATETAFQSINKAKLKNLSDKGNKKAALTLKLSEDDSALLTTVLICKTISAILLASIVTVLFSDVFMPNSTAPVTLAVSVAVTVLAILIFGEAIPRAIAKKAADKSAMYSAVIINCFRILFYPLGFLFNRLQALLSKIFKEEGDKGMPEEELISILEEAEEDGNIDEEESTLIKSAIEFNDLEVGDIFTPRIDITAIDSSATKEELASLFSNSGYSRIPIYENDLDNILGIVYYKDFYTTSFGRETPISEIIKPVIYVTKTQKINDLLKELQEKQLHLAVVTDEYGSTAGIVTLEDILEEIVGEIWDEHDEIVEEIKELKETEYIVSGKANIEKLFDQLEITVSEDEEIESLTVNGWAMDILGRIPEVGDKFEFRGLNLNVLEMDGRRIEKLHIFDTRNTNDNKSNDCETQKDSNQEI